jgi:hypothetical protein
MKADLHNHSCQLFSCGKNLGKNSAATAFLQSKKTWKKTVLK